MMSDEYEPPKDNENTVLDNALDNDGADTTAPGTPGATSTPYPPGTPYHGGESHEMTTLPQEESGVVQGPGEAAWNALTFLYPNASAVDLEAFMDPKTQRLMIKKAGAGKASYYLFTQDRTTKEQRLNPKLSMEIRNALGESAEDQARSLQQERDANIQELRAKEQRKPQLEAAAQESQSLRREMDALRDRIRQLDDEMNELEDKAGPLDEETKQKWKDEHRALELEHQKKREQLEQTRARAQEALQLQTEINDLKLANRDIDRQINKLGMHVAKPPEELRQEKAELEKKVVEGRRVLEDENASSSDKEAAKKQVEQDEGALERINEDIERQEERLPLRERVKEIFKKYGWTLQAVVLAAGINISVVVLTTLNGLKAATKAIGNGLKELAKKAAAALPGLIGSIVGFIFKTAGSVISFLGEHAWLLILAVMAFLVERVTKRARKS